MQVIKASEFKAKCLHLMDEVNRTREDIVITKNGVPVSRMVAYNQSVESLFGLHKNLVVCHDDLIEPVDEVWAVDP